MPLELEDDVLGKIIPFITLKKYDKETYFEDFRFVLEHIIELICLDDNFRKLYVGYNIVGSYADDLKISKPDEFDSVLELQFPNYELIQIQRHSLNGYCAINASNLISKLDETKEDESFKKFLIMMSSNDGILKQNEITEWFVNILTNILENLLPGSVFIKNNKKFKIKHRKNGPAYTLYINDYEIRSFSIDLVPAFVFNQSHWIAKRPCPTNIDPIKWIAIPKPINKRDSFIKNNCAFLTSFADLERHLIIDNLNLKITLKLMKKIRDRREGLSELKSYFIKTVFLWKIDKNDLDNINNNQFWDQPIQILTTIMFEELISFFESKSLPFYWNSSFNMLCKFTDHQITSMTNKIKSIYRMLINFDSKIDEDKIKIYDLFLYRHEIQEIGGKMSNKIKKRSKRHLEKKLLDKTTNNRQ